MIIIISRLSNTPSTNTLQINWVTRLPKISRAVNSPSMSSLKLWEWNPPQCLSRTCSTWSTRTMTASYPSGSFWMSLLYFQTVGVSSVHGRVHYCYNIHITAFNLVSADLILKYNVLIDWLIVLINSSNCMQVLPRANPGCYLICTIELNCWC